MRTRSKGGLADGKETSKEVFWNNEIKVLRGLCKDPVKELGIAHLRAT